MIDGRNMEGFDNAGLGQEDECHSVESTPGSGSPKASKYYPVWRDSQEFKQLVEGKHAGEAQAGTKSNSDGDRFRAAATVALVMAALFVLIGVVL